MKKIRRKSISSSDKHKRGWRKVLLDAIVSQLFSTKTSDFFDNFGSNFVEFSVINRRSDKSKFQGPIISLNFRGFSPEKKPKIHFFSSKKSQWLSSFTYALLQWPFFQRASSEKFAKNRQKSSFWKFSWQNLENEELERTMRRKFNPSDFENREKEESDLLELENHG